MSCVCPRVIRANRGDLLSRQGILQSLLESGVTDAVVCCHDPTHLGPLNCRTASYGLLFNLIPTWEGFHALRRADTVLWTAGLDLQDDSSLTKLVHTLLVFTSYRLLGLRIIALMQGAGPLRTRLGRWLTRRILNRTDVFLARDPATLKLLRSLNSRCRLVLSHDGVFAGDPLAATLAAPEQSYVQELIGSEPGRPVIGLNLRLWFHFASGILPYQFAKRRYRARAEARMTQLISASAALLRALRERFAARVILFSMYEPDIEPWEDDLPYLERLKAEFANQADVRVAREHLSLRGFCELLRQLNLVVGMRLHSALTALRLGVPAIHLAYTLKGRDIYAALGLSEFVVDVEAFLDRPAVLTEKIAGALSDERLVPRIQQVTARAMRENRRVLDELFAESARGAP